MIEEVKLINGDRKRNKRSVNISSTRGRIFAIVLAIACLLIASCGKDDSIPEKVRIGALKGPTTMGILKLLEDQTEQTGQTEQSDQSDNLYDFTMATGADELLPLMVKGELDIALVPANVAAVMYGKTEGNIAVVDINTLGVLYFVTGSKEVNDIKDLAGKTIYLTGKGTTPEYVLTYLLKQAQVESCTLEFKSEATEVAAVLQAEPEAVGFLPQPFVSAALMQNDALRVIASAQELWTAYAGEGQGIVTGVTVVRKDFLKEYESQVRDFVQKHKESTDWINEHTEEGAALAVKYGIVGKEPIARKAIPQCNITCIYGEGMKTSLEAYLKVLYEMEPKTIGGALPADDFYYAD